MEIAIDFDGTCVTHEFPNVGKDIGAAPILRRLVDAGHRLILFTMRSDGNHGASGEFPDINGGLFLTDAINWFKDNGIELYGIQKNPEQTWTTSPKAYAQLYIDDASLGCPLLFKKDISPRPFVDWERVENTLMLSGILPFKS